MEISISGAKKSDAPILNDLLTKLIKEEKKHDDNVNDNIQIKSYYENIIDNDSSCILIARYQNDVVGYLYGSLFDQGDSYLKLTSVIDALYIENEFRNKGIGSALIETFKNWSLSKGVEIIEIKVLNNNNSAINTYKKSGFIETKTIMSIEL